MLRILPTRCWYRARMDTGRHSLCHAIYDSELEGSWFSTCGSQGGTRIQEGQGRDCRKGEGGGSQRGRVRSLVWLERAPGRTAEPNDGSSRNPGHEQSWHAGASWYSGPYGGWWLRNCQSWRQYASIRLEWHDGPKPSGSVWYLCDADDINGGTCSSSIHVPHECSHGCVSNQHGSSCGSCSVPIAGVPHPVVASGLCHRKSTVKIE
mmetsp:Transcript_15403/g.26994  ORF Transcript_15403/g.26994 Transcript_15403/m.26994 type:complete len:207 (+) Transcript_15403:198-818(+)